MYIRVVGQHFAVQAMYKARYVLARLTFKQFLLIGAGRFVAHQAYKLAYF